MTATAVAPRIFMVDDHPVVRAGLAMILRQEGLEVCGEAVGRAQALEQVPAAAPALVLLDLTLGGEDGLDLLQALRVRAPGVPVLVYSMHEDMFHIERAFAAGAKGYVTKQEVAGVLLEAIRQVLRGQLYMSPATAQAMAKTLARGPAAAPAGPAAELTAQERRVYELLASGATTADIAAEMALSPRTVESYYARIQLKLDLRNMKELRRRAIQTGGRA